MKQLRFKIDFVELRIFMNHLTFREFVRIVGSGVPSNFREVSDSEGPGAYRRNGMSKVKPWRPAAPSSPACFRRPPPSFCGVFHLFQAVRKGFWENQNIRQLWITIKLHCRKMACLLSGRINMECIAITSFRITGPTRVTRGFLTHGATSWKSRTNPLPPAGVPLVLCLLLGGRYHLYQRDLIDATCWERKPTFNDYSAMITGLMAGIISRRILVCYGEILERTKRYTSKNITRR